MRIMRRLYRSVWRLWKAWMAYGESLRFLYVYELVQMLSESSFYNNIKTLILIYHEQK